jgi:hypothetical protein
MSWTEWSKPTTSWTNPSQPSSSWTSWGKSTISDWFASGWFSSGWFEGWGIKGNVSTTYVEPSKSTTSWT